MVLSTIASVILAALIGVGVVSPLLFAAAVFPFFHAALRFGDHRAGLLIVFRWALSLFVTLVIVGIFLPDRLGGSLPFAESAARSMQAWIAGSPSPPVDSRYMFWGMLVFLAGSVASGGLVGFVVGAVALGGAAYSALFVFRHGHNIFEAALVALPVWQLGLFIAGAFFIVPAAVFVFERFLGAEKRLEDRGRLRLYVYVGAGFFALSILLRYATAGAWRTLLDRWTVL